MKNAGKSILLAVVMILGQSFGVYGAYSSVGSGVKITSGAVVSSNVIGNTVGAETNGTKVNINNLKVELVQGPASKISIPDEDSKIISAINSGESLDGIIKDLDLSGYKTLVKTSTITVKNKDTNTETKGEAVVEFYVPNLLESLNDVQVLFYDQSTGKWILLKPEGIDYANKRISIKITGSGVFTFIYR